jgi:hypothetical protein
MKVESLNVDTVISLGKRITEEYEIGGEFCIRLYSKKDKLLCTLFGDIETEGSITGTPLKMIENALASEWRGEFSRGGKVRYGVFEALSSCACGLDRKDGEFFAFTVRDPYECYLSGGLRMNPRGKCKGHEIIINRRKVNDQADIGFLIRSDCDEY